MDDGTMTVDCGTCPVRHRHCDGCMVAVLLSSPPPRRLDGTDESNGTDLAPAAPEGRHPEGMEPDAVERRALGALVRAGLVDEFEARTATAVRDRVGRWAHVG